MLYTTLARIRACKPCEPHWSNGLRAAGMTKADDTIAPYAKIVELCGLRSALWAMHVEPKYATSWRQFAEWCSQDALQFPGEHVIFAPPNAKRGDADPDDGLLDHIIGKAWRRLLEAEPWDAAYEVAQAHEFAAGRAGRAEEAAEARKRKFLEIVGDDNAATKNVTVQPPLRNRSIFA